MMNRIPQQLPGKIFFVVVVTIIPYFTVIANMYFLFFPYETLTNVPAALAV
jgi:hypothetical protein